MSEATEAPKEGAKKGSGKTARKRRNGVEARRRANRAAHEDWMKKVVNQPNHAYPHPSEK